MATKIKSMDVTRFRVEECFGFMKRVEAETSLLTLETDAQMVKDFKAAVTAFDEALKTSLKNSKTADVAAADSQVDKAWRTLTQVSKSFTEHPADVIRAIAAEVYAIMQKYGNITNMAYNEQYGSLHNALQELSAISKPNLELLLLDEIINELQTGYDSFMKASSERDAEQAQKQIGIVKQMRVACEDAYRTFVGKVNALVVVNGEDAYTTFIDHINVIIDSARSTLANRSTKAANRRTAQAETTETVEE